MSWLSAALGLIRSLLDLIVGNPGEAAARESLSATQHELDRERKINAALRLRIVEKERRIRALEKSLAERDPGALLDSVFGGTSPDPAKT